MTEISGDVERGEMRTPMLFGRFRAWLAMVTRQSGPKDPTLQVDLA